MISALRDEGSRIGVDAAGSYAHSIRRSRCARQGEERENGIEDEALPEAVHILPLTSQIARIAGDLRRAHAGLKAFDSRIAATALFTHSQLITRNSRDFHDIDGLPLLAI
jgi:predicted nucleic acid-binding protein